MKIRTLLLTISVIGAVSAASVVLFFMNEKLEVQETDNNSLQFAAYSEAWNRIMGEDIALLEGFGLQGSSSYFWSPENPSPLNRGDGPGIYALDLSGTGTGDILNPLVTAIMSDDVRGSNRFLRLFFGVPFQRREISFYSIISARNFEPTVCQKSVFSRAFDPCSTIFETSFLDKGSRFELFGSVANSGESWSGYMKQSSPETDNFTIVHTFPVAVNNVTEFIVLIGKPLSEAVSRLSDELNIEAKILNLNGTAASIRNTENLSETASGAFLLNALGNDRSIKTLVAPDATTRLICRVYSYLGLQGNQCDGAGVTNIYSLLPLSEGDDYQVVLSRDITDIAIESDEITLDIIAYSLLSILSIISVLYLIQRQVFNRLSGAIFVLNELSQGNLLAEPKATKSIFASDSDEIGQLTSALSIYRQSLRDLENERSVGREQRLEREKLIIDKMRVLADQLEGEAKDLILNDISKMEGLSDSDNQNSDENSTKLISLAFARMSDEVLALIQAKTHEMVAARDEANDANLAKSKFLANMSHELRTPLNAIIGYSELLIEEAEDLGVDSMTEDLKRITDSGSHLLSLINDILDISKIEAGRLELFITEFDLAKTLEMTQGLASPLGEKNDNKVVFEFEENLGLMNNDETRVRQCIINLISNACKFTSNGLVSVTAVKKEKGEREIVEFIVKDTGIGMKDEQLQKIFEEFSQASDDTTSKFGGTGLGLTITKTLVEMMGGSVSVVSEEGVGSAFTLEIPLRYEKRLTLDPAEQQSDESVVASSNYPLILIIDDDINIHEIVKRKLSSENFRIISAMNGFDGIRKADIYRPDLILVDILMPGKDGWNTILEINATDGLESIPVVVISTLDEKLTSSSFGAKAFVQKPIDKDILLKEIRTIFDENLKSLAALVIDDDANARELAVRILSGAGFSVDSASNGKEGIEKLQLGFDLVVLDLQMPVMDGFEFLRELDFGNHYIPKDPHIIVYSSLQLDEVVREKLEVRCSGILDKNGINSQADLENTISRLIG